jgi:hypothetical protein
VIDEWLSHISGDYSTFVKQIESTHGNFCIASNEGHTPCWRLSNRLSVVHATLDDSDLWPTGDLRHALDEITGSEIVIREPLYRDSEYGKKLTIITPDLVTISDEVIAYLSENPEALQQLHWRTFEELLETLFASRGYDTELCPGSGDGGVDLRLIRRHDFGDLLFLVQAKRHVAHNTIALQPVQALYGAVAAEGASKGLFVATSEFQPVAKRFAKSHSYRIDLAGPDKLAEWLKDYRKRNC